MTALTTTPAQASADPRLGSIVRPYVAVSEVIMLQAVYLDSDGKVAPADANAGTTEAAAIGVVCGPGNMYGETTIAAGGSVDVCIFGPVYGFSGLTPGATGWVSKTAGEIEDEAPTDAVQRIIGHAIEDDVFFVDPGQAADASA